MNYQHNQYVNLCLQIVSDQMDRFKYFIVHINHYNIYLNNININLIKPNCPSDLTIRLKHVYYLIITIKYCTVWRLNQILSLIHFYQRNK